MKYKLLAIDMDGTFLNEEHKPTEGNLAAAKKAAEAGIKVVVCSGRILAALKLLLRDMPKNQPVIAANGSIILDHNGNEIYNKPLDLDVANNIIDLLRNDYEGMYYHFFHGDIICSEKFEGITERFYRINSTLPREYRIECRIVPDSKEYIKFHNPIISKFEIYEENLDLLTSVKAKLENFPGIELVPSGFSAVEITKKGLSKGSSLEILAKHYGYSLEECIAIGNDGNDIEMLKKAGLGIAVSNARDYVKEVADYVTERDNNNDAVAEAIEKFILPFI